MASEGVTVVLAHLGLWLAVCSIIAIGALLAGAMWWAVSGSWWPTTVVQFHYRRRRSLYALARTGMAVSILVMALGVTGCKLGILVFLLFAPRYISRYVRLKAWQDDDDDTRDAARTIRNRLRGGLEEPPIADGEGPWREYVNDVVRARRDRVYQSSRPGAASA